MKHSLHFVYFSLFFFLRDAFMFGGLLTLLFLICSIHWCCANEDDNASNVFIACDIGTTSPSVLLWTLLVRLPTGCNDWQGMSHSFGLSTTVFTSLGQMWLLCDDKKRRGEWKCHTNKMEGRPFFWCQDLWSTSCNMQRFAQKPLPVSDSAESESSKGQPGTVWKPQISQQLSIGHGFASLQL